MTSIYQPLSSNRHIRLMSLADHEVQPGQTLRCNFEDRDLDEIPPWDSYSALSYVWSSSLERVEIICNGQPAHITTNLYHALVQIWSLTARRVLWADALCINQNDDLEKGHQVGMMGSIYRLAGTVIVWFGKTDNLIASLWMSLRRGEKYNEGADVGVRLEVNIDHFLRQRWFYRTWTFQELLLAPRAIALCGPYWIEWRLLMSSITPVGPLRGLERNAALLQAPKKVSGKSPLTQMILATWDRVASDPRDRIYAVLGLLPNPQVHANYSITVTQLFTIVIITNMEAHGDVSLLHACGSGWAKPYPHRTTFPTLHKNQTLQTQAATI